MHGIAWNGLFPKLDAPLLEPVGRIARQGELHQPRARAIGIDIGVGIKDSREYAK
jgi:hypothetical protein